MGSYLIKKAEKVMRSLYIQRLNQDGLKRINYNYHIIHYYPPIGLLPFRRIKSSLLSKNPERCKSLYLHIPFCAHKCSYCPFLSFNGTKFLISAYIEAIKKELSILFKGVNREVVLKTIYLGGGTPTYLNAHHLQSLLGFINDKLSIAKNAEITCEVSPETLIGRNGKDKLITLRKGGVNRLSLGIQCTDEQILNLIGRKSNKNEMVLAMKNINQAGFENVNLDIMFGLPMQTLQSWESTLNFASSLNPSSVSTLQLGFSPFSMFYRNIYHNLPSDEANLKMKIMAQEFFKEKGYKERYVDYFTLSEKSKLQHVKEVWEKSGDLVSAGASAFSYVNDHFYCNCLNLKKYIRCIKHDQLPVFRAKKLSNGEMLRRKIVLGLKTRIHKKDLKQFSEGNMRGPNSQTFSKLKNLGLLEETQKYMMLTLKGRLFADEICMQFYSPKEKLVYGMLKFLNSMINPFLVKHVKKN